MAKLSVTKQFIVNLKILCENFFLKIFHIIKNQEGDVCVGINLYFQLVTTLIHFYEVIELIIQFSVSLEHSSVNQVLMFTPSFIVSTKSLVCVMRSQCKLSDGRSNVFRVQQGKHNIQYLPSETISTKSSMVTEFEATSCDQYGLRLHLF